MDRWAFNYKDGDFLLGILTTTKLVLSKHLEKRKIQKQPDNIFVSELMFLSVCVLCKRIRAQELGCNDNIPSGEGALPPLLLQLPVGQSMAGTKSAHRKTGNKNQPEVSLCLFWGICQLKHWIKSSDSVEGKSTFDVCKIYYTLLKIIFYRKLVCFLHTKRVLMWFQGLWRSPPWAAAPPVCLGGFHISLPAICIWIFLTSPQFLCTNAGMKARSLKPAAAA